MDVVYEVPCLATGARRSRDGPQWQSVYGCPGVGECPGSFRLISES